MKASDRTLDDWIDDIVASVTAIDRHTRALTFEEFASNEPVLGMTLWRLSLIGEAARYIRDLHPEVVDANREIPWRDMIDMRNQLVHGYFDMSPAILWHTVTLHLPELRANLDRLAGSKSGGR